MSSSEPIRVYVGADRSQQLAISVLEYSIRRHTTADVRVIPMVDLPVPRPKDPRNGQRTGFSFSRFCIPKLAGYEGKAIYMDADMLVFRDLRELWDIPLEGHKVLIQKEVKHQETSTAKIGAPKKRKKQCAVMLLDCSRLDWDIDQIVAGLDEGRYDYDQLMSDLCILPEQDVGYGVPFEWNSLEHHDADTRLLHYTDVYTQPWTACGNPNAQLWLDEVRHMLRHGALTWKALQTEIDLGYFRPSLLRDLRWRHMLPRRLWPAWDRRNAARDKQAGYVPHKAVYEAKRLREQAIKEYDAAQAAARAKRAAPPLGRQFPGAAGSPHYLVFTENFNATYYISFEIPLSRLRERGELGFGAWSHADVEAAGPRCWEAWILECQPRAVVLTRYGRTDGPDILAFCRAHGVPVVYHIDDDLLQLPDSLGDDSIKRHTKPEIVQARRDMLAGCDLVYASTAVLADVLRDRFPSQRIFHGIYAAYLPDVLPHLPAPGDAETIGYMGSKGHREDLELAVPAIVQLMQERPGLRFETFGTIGMPEELAAFGDRVRHYPVQKSYADFLRTLAALRWRIGLAPLVDSPFNRCKAPTKYIEYSSCGIATLASDVVVYASAVPPGGGELVRGDWHGALARWLDDPGRVRSHLHAARTHCARTYSVEALAQQVLRVFELLPQARPA